MNLLKRFALRLLGNDLAQAAEIIAGVTTQATHIERNFLLALERKQPSALKLSNGYEAETFETLAIIALDSKLHLRLEIKCANTEALRLVAIGLPKTRFNAADVRFEDSVLVCRMTLGVTREQVADYHAMLPR